ncbi:hypothetical protein FBY35_5957 [Streptomyces sp. SLBN-118]|uniref:hypothetical protein n=1 Tax=Streptomyces sp. SLBN-118 TaxID=2768454 RepID=UPI0011520195|nr:hypothetical protein [Streptomyces sp. SLBN-118]TQK44453.1 hypothetical protein FBY35_5957 [Streptomyces sp. SLBN-118]
MPATYNTEGAADPKLYARLMEERYGPLPQLLAERRSVSKKPPPGLSTPDPEAAQHYAELAAAIGARTSRK